MVKRNEMKRARSFSKVWASGAFVFLQISLCLTLGKAWLRLASLNATCCSLFFCHESTDLVSGREVKEEELKVVPLRSSTVKVHVAIGRHLQSSDRITQALSFVCLYWPYVIGHLACCLGLQKQVSSTISDATRKAQHICCVVLPSSACMIFAMAAKSCLHEENCCHLDRQIAIITCTYVIHGGYLSME